MEQHKKNFVLHPVSSVSDLKRQLRQSFPDIVVFDLSMGYADFLDIASFTEARIPLVCIIEPGKSRSLESTLGDLCFDYILKSPHSLIDFPNRVLVILRNWQRTNSGSSRDCHFPAR